MNQPSNENLNNQLLSTSSNQSYLLNTQTQQILIDTKSTQILNIKSSPKNKSIPSSDQPSKPIQSNKDQKLSSIDINNSVPKTNTITIDLNQLQQINTQQKKVKKPPAKFLQRMKKKQKQPISTQNQPNPNQPKPNNQQLTQSKHKNNQDTKKTKNKHAIQQKNTPKINRNSPDQVPIGANKNNPNSNPTLDQPPPNPTNPPKSNPDQRPIASSSNKKNSHPQTPLPPNKNTDDQSLLTTTKNNPFDQTPLSTNKNKNNNLDQIPITDNKNNNIQDQRPINGNNKNLYDQKPIASNNKNSYDQLPIGQKKKIQFSQYPQEGHQPTKPPVKKNKGKTQKNSAKPAAIPPPGTPISTAISLDEVPVGSTPIRQGPSQFDQVPIGKASNAFAMSQFPQGQQQPVTQTNYTMSQKLKSKAIKLKLSGMQDLLQLLQKDPNNQQIQQIQMSKLLKQTNPAPLQKILQCLKVWVQKGKKYGDDQIKNALQNGYINGKPNTKKLTVQIIDQMYQKSSDVVQMTLLVGLKGKVPKNLAGYLSFLNQLLAIYGMKKMKFFKPYFNDIVIILNRQKLVAVKTQGINLLKQTYKWLTKQVVQPLIKDLKQGLKKQLDTFWENYDKTQTMNAPKDVPQTTGDGKPKKKIDAYELSEAVDIFKKYNQKWSQQVINEQKWSQKVKMMTQFISAANVPKLAHNSQHRHITQMIRRLINHSNFNVVISDLKIMAVLSKGLRRHFAPTVRAQFSNVLGKFRDKKSLMIQQTFNVLNQFSYCISIQEVIDDVKQGLCDKTPNMKINILNWISKFIQKKLQEKDQLPDKVKQAIRSLFPTFEKLLTDGVAEVRDTMVKNIGKMKIMMGDDFFTPMNKKMSKGQAGKLDQLKKQLPSKITPKQSKKQPQQSTTAPTTATTTSRPPKDKGISNKTLQNNSMILNQAKGIDINDQIQQIIPKLTHSDWQKRKQSAQNLINLISNNNDCKINSNTLFDLLNILKTRIADPNKNIVKYFVQLTGLIFENMSEKDVKNNAKNFICTLADGLSDKQKANRKQISLTINKIGAIFGRQQLLTILGSYLDTDKQSRIQILNLILQNQQCIEKADIRQYPKGIIKGLTDKNKQIRNLAQKLLERVHQKLGLQVFKNLAKNQLPVITKDLNILLSKYESSSKQANSNVSKGSSPPKQKNNSIIQSTISQKKIINRSDSKNKLHSQNFQVNCDNQDHNISGKKQYYASMQIQTNANNNYKGKSLIQGNQDFAPLKILSNQRVKRQQKDQRYPWMCDNISQSQQDELRQSLQALFKPELVKKMLSVDYRKVIEAASQIIKLSKDIAHHNQIRQVYDLILKWVFVRLWGGNPSIQMILQVLPHVMTVLQKKKLVITVGQVDIMIAILRQSFISGYMNQFKVSQSLYSITRLLIALSSGDRLLKNFFKQFTIELYSIHKHVRKQTTQFYRYGLNRLIKNQLMEYVGHGTNLQQASKIKQLKSDVQFVELLYKRFHQNLLDSFQFRVSIPPPTPPPLPPHANNKKLSPLPTKNTGEQATIQPPHSATLKHTFHPPSNNRTPTQSVQGRPPIIRHQDLPNRLTQTQKQIELVNHKQPPAKQQIGQEIDLTIYTMPQQGNPLGRHLSKLMAPGEIPDTVVGFFTNMFGESGDKITSQLTTYANIIFGAILKSVKNMLDHRNDYMPQKIINQINLLQHAIKHKQIINHIDKQLLYQSTKFALCQLVYQDDNKNMIAQALLNKGLDFKPQTFLKVVNGIMLRIIQNACPQQIVNILLNLLNKQLQMSQSTQKTMSLIIKCLGRVSTNYSADINSQRTKQFFIQTVQYFSIICLKVNLADFNPHQDQKLKPQQNILKTIKQIINQLIKRYSSQIWVYYQMAMNHSRFIDTHITQYIRSMGVPFPQNIQKLSQEDEQLKKINQLLSKNKTFDNGIIQLKKYISVNPNFVPLQYFTHKGCEQKFIIMVLNALQINSRPKRTPTKKQIREDRSQNNKQHPQIQSQSSIQDKIQKIRMRFGDQSQNKPQQKPSIQSSIIVSNIRRDDGGGQQRAQQIKRRIDQMKNRLNRN